MGVWIFLTSNTGKIIMITLKPGDEYIIFGVLTAEVQGIHSVSDNFTEEQWSRAEELRAELQSIVDSKVE